MIDEGAIVAIARYGDAASVGKEIAIECAHPAQVIGFLARAEPTGGARHVEDRAPLRRRGRIRRDRVYLPAVGNATERPAHHVELGAIRVVVDDLELPIGEAG